MNEILQDDQKLYQCGQCGLKYKDREWAEKCENWCKEHQSCNLEIIEKAVDRSNSL